MHTDVETLGVEYPQYRLPYLLSVCSSSTLENLSALALPRKTDFWTCGIRKEWKWWSSSFHQSPAISAHGQAASFLRT